PVPSRTTRLDRSTSSDPVHPAQRIDMDLDLALTGTNVGKTAATAISSNPKLAIGERLSMCGRFGINASGHWRELPAAQQSQQPHEFAAVAPDGKPIQGAAHRS
ncbi:hypothetical protein QJQ45_020730, partial [Haematococcus lacustris]